MFRPPGTTERGAAKGKHIGWAGDGSTARPYRKVYQEDDNGQDRH
jgi:hypothetical protein